MTSPFGKWRASLLFSFLVSSISSPKRLLEWTSKNTDPATTLLRHLFSGIWWCQCWGPNLQCYCKACFSNHLCPSPVLLLTKPVLYCLYPAPSQSRYFLSSILILVQDDLPVEWSSLLCVPWHQVYWEARTLLTVLWSLLSQARFIHLLTKLFLNFPREKRSSLLIPTLLWNCPWKFLLWSCRSCRWISIVSIFYFLLEIKP